MIDTKLLTIVFITSIYLFNFYIFTYKYNFIKIQTLYHWNNENYVTK